MKKLFQVAVIGAALGMAMMVSSPAQADFPEGHSMTFHDVVGSIIDCVDFVRCNKAECPMRWYFDGTQCKYANIEGDHLPGITVTTATCRGLDYGGGLPVTDFSAVLACNRNRQGNWTWFFPFFPTGHCVMSSTLVGTPFGSLNDGTAGVTMISRLTCDDVFGRGAKPVSLRSRTEDK
jgi:hypothetical protein